jgi:RNA polymerase sigma-70 factor (ECF subfamily)
MDIRRALLDAGAMTNSGKTPRPSILNAEGFDHFYRNYHDRILRYLRREVSDDQLALDLTHDTFINAFKGQGKFRGTTKQEEQGWLWSIAKNQLRQHLRTKSVASAALRRLDAPRPTARDEALERIDEIDAARQLIGEARTMLSRLKPLQRQAIEMHILEELDYAEIAGRLGVREGTLRKRVCDGLRDLRSTCCSEWDQTDPDRSLRRLTQ